MADKETLFAAVNTHHTPFLDNIIQYVTYMGEAWVIVVVLLLLFAYSSNRNWWYIITATLSNVLPTVVTQSLKSAYGAPRPLKYFNEAAWVHTLPEWPRLMERSFPSGHSCGAFSLFCFLSLLLSPQKRGLGSIFFVLALAVGYSRLYLAAHFFEDVYVGSIIGTTVSVVVVTIMNRFTHVFFKTK